MILRFGGPLVQEGTRRSTIPPNRITNAITPEKFARSALIDAPPPAMPDSSILEQPAEDVGGAAQLEAALTVAFTVTGALTTAIPLDAAMTLSFTVATSLTTVIRFVAAATVVFTVTADLTSGVAAPADSDTRPWQESGAQWTNFFR